MPPCGLRRADGRALRRISAFNKTDALDPASDLPNAAKFLLYQDPLTGLYDLDVEGLGFAEQYACLEREFSGYEQRGDRWSLLYRFYALLARVLKNKAELGLRAYRACQAGDLGALGALAAQARQAADDCGPCWNAGASSGCGTASPSASRCWRCGWPACAPGCTPRPTGCRVAAPAPAAWRSWKSPPACAAHRGHAKAPRRLFLARDHKRLQSILSGYGKG